MSPEKSRLLDRNGSQETAINRSLEVLYPWTSEFEGLIQNIYEIFNEAGLNSIQVRDGVKDSHMKRLSAQGDPTTCQLFIGLTRNAVSLLRDIELSKHVTDGEVRRKMVLGSVQGAVLAFKECQK